MKKINVFLMAFLLIALGSCKKDDDEDKKDEQPQYEGSFSGETVYVESGTFMMGNDNASEDDEKPAHKVKLDGFFISKYEITNKQYADFLNEIHAQNDGTFNGTIYININNSNCQIEYTGGQFKVKNGKENYPVSLVTWDGADAYAKHYDGRLPTEAEWEFAARGGNESKKYTYSGSNVADIVAWYLGNSNQSGGLDFDGNGHGSHPVGQKDPNELGIYDMSGNVQEWCNDLYSATYYANSPSENPPGPNVNNDEHILRGGCSLLSEEYSRTTRRNSAHHWVTYPDGGFRPVFNLKK